MDSSNRFDDGQNVVLSMLFGEDVNSAQLTSPKWCTDQEIARNGAREGLLARMVHSRSISRPGVWNQRMTLFNCMAFRLGLGYFNR